jgi:hypothetical protein
MTYDVVVYEDLDFHIAHFPGRIVCHAEGLSLPEYTVPEPLINGRHYFWTEREHKGTFVGPWALHNGTYVIGNVIITQRGLYPRFKARAN